MHTPPFISNIVSWGDRNLRPILAVSIAPAIVGFLTDRFVGGRVAEISGRIQAGFLCAYLFLAITIVLFYPYEPRTTRVLEFFPIALLRIVIFIVAAAIALYMVAVTVFSLLLEFS